MNKEETKIIFWGTSEFAKEILASLLENKYTISLVVTQTDKKIGRNQEFKLNPVKEFSISNKIPVLQPQVFDREIAANIRRFNPDLMVVVAYGKIIPEEILGIPKSKSINVHPSLLPKFRGPSPIQNAILSGEKETGITIMLLDKKMDHGDILNQTKIQIGPDDTTETLTQKIIAPSSKLLQKTIPDWIDGKITPQKQNDSEATYCQLIEREDGHIFWDEEIKAIYNKYRALQSWPGIFSAWENNNNLMRIKLNKIKVYGEKPDSAHRLGEVVSLNVQVGVRAADGIIILEEIQLQGKKPVAINEFINGYPNFVGSILK